MDFAMVRMPLADTLTAFRHRLGKIWGQLTY